MTLLYEFLAGKDPDDALADYSYGNYVAEWSDLFGTADSGVRRYWGVNGNLQSVVVRFMSERQFEKQKDALLQSMPNSWDELAAELALLL